jgi:hypothetical protein
MSADHIVARPDSTATAESAAKCARAALLLVVSLAGLLLSACGGEPAATGACSPRDSRAYGEAVAPIVNRLYSVESLSHIADTPEKLDGYITELQSLRQQAADLEIPACAENSRAFLLERIDTAIEELSSSTPFPASLVGLTETPAPEAESATPGAALSAATSTATATQIAATPTVTETPAPTETPTLTETPTATLTMTPTFRIGPPRPTATPTATITPTPDPDITTRVEAVWLCEWLGPGQYRWYEVEITMDLLTPVAEEILSGPYVGPWQSNCPVTTPVPTTTPGG